MQVTVSRIRATGQQHLQAVESGAVDGIGLALSHFSPSSLSVSRPASVSWLSGFSSHSDGGFPRTCCMWHSFASGKHFRGAVHPNSRLAGSRKVCHPLVSQLAEPLLWLWLRSGQESESGSGISAQHRSGGSEPLVKCVANGQWMEMANILSRQ